MLAAGTPLIFGADQDSALQLRNYGSPEDGFVWSVVRAWPADLRSAGNVLALDLPDAVRPLECGLEDGCMLGVQVFSPVIEMVD